MPKLVTPRLTLNQIQAGSGPDLVMVHGVAANLAFWYLKTVPAFSDAFRVTVYDQRGHGASEQPPTGYTGRDLAEDLLGLMDQLGIERADLLGHSIGGGVCLHLAAWHPERVRSVTVVDTRLHCFQPVKTHDNEAFWAEKAKEFEARGITIPKNTPKVFYSLMEELQPLVDQGQVNRNAVPGLMSRDGAFDARSRSAQRWIRLVSETTFPGDIQDEAGLTREVLAAIKAPVLAIYGGNSSLLPSCEALCATIPGARAVVHPGRGHFFPVAEPQLVIDPLRAFLAGR